MTDLFERAKSIGTNRPIFNPRKRIAQAAEQLNQAGNLQAQLGVCEAALVALVNVLYAMDAEQRPANYDAATGRILIGLPWGSRGWKRWGLRRMEADCLRRVMLGRSGDSHRPRLLIYAADCRQWYIDFETYPTLDSALAWVRDHGPRLSEWRDVIESHRLSEIARKIG